MLIWVALKQTTGCLCCLRESKTTLPTELLTYFMQVTSRLNPVMDCNRDCSCDYVKYNPVCSQDGEQSFISACHAGCKRQELVNGTKWFFDCSCIDVNNEARFERLLGLPSEVCAVLTFIT